MIKQGAAIFNRTLGMRRLNLQEIGLLLLNEIVNGQLTRLESPLMFRKSMESEIQGYSLVS